MSQLASVHNALGSEKKHTHTQTTNAHTHTLQGFEWLMTNQIFSDSTEQSQKLMKAEDLVFFVGVSVCNSYYEKWTGSKNMSNIKE